ncbi:MAG TPA: CARDB domain-containing protein [Blastocatellia bacterium]|nr:CARDB domain-containing protein [Blastocatellia bacterium]
MQTPSTSNNRSTILSSVNRLTCLGRSPSRRRLHLLISLAVSLLVTASGMLIYSRAGQPVSKQASTEPGRASSAVRELKIHGPFLLTREELAKAGQRARKFRPDPDDSDDFDDSNPAGPCIGPFCPEARAGESTLQIRTPPPTSTPWEVDPAIGALDPQIAASRTSLVVTAGVKIAFYGKDGKLLAPALFTKEFFKPLWDPARADNINTFLNLPPSDTYKCDPTDPDNPKSNRCLKKYFDTRVVFDGYRHRFWVGALARNVSSPSEHQDSMGNFIPTSLAVTRTKFLLGVSLTEDPRDGFYMYWWDANVDDGRCFNTTGDECPDPALQPGDGYRPGDGSDYPCIGISEKYFLHANAVGNGLLDKFPQPGADKLRYTIINVMPADALANGNVAPEPSWSYWNIRYPANSNNIFRNNAIQPAVHHGAAPAAAAFLASTLSDQTMIVWYFTPLQGPVSPPLNFVNVPVGRFSGVSDAPQKAFPFQFANLIRVGNLGNIALKAAYRNNRLYVTWQDCVVWPDAKASGCVNAIRLVSFDIPTFSRMIDRSFGERNIFDDGPKDLVYYGNPAVEVNKDDHKVVVYTRSGANVYLEARYSAYFANEPDIRPSALLHAGEFPVGTAPPPKPAPPPKQQLGMVGQLDTGGIAVDPFDDTAVWMAHAFAYKIDDKNGGVKLAVGKVFGQKYSDLFFPENPAALAGAVHQGGQMQVAGMIGNQGDGAAEVVPFAVYLSRPDADDLLLGEFRLDQPALESGEKAGFRVKVAIPPQLRPGEYFVKVVINPHRQVDEYSQDNNSAFAQKPLRVVGRGASSVN